MKLLGRYPPVGQEGSLRLVAEQGEDLWHIFNLVREGDQVTATTFRKVQAGMSGTEVDRVKLKLTVTVEAVDFDPEGQEIRIRGRNLTDTEHIKLGAYHTLELELHRAFTLHKQLWDSVDVNRTRQACNPALSADLAVVLMTEGLANLFLIGGTTVITKPKVEVSMPSKRGAAAAGFEKARNNFFDRLLQAIVRDVDWEVVKCLVLAGPGFTKDAFRSHLDAEAVRQDIRPLILNKQKIVVAHAASPYKHSLKDVFDNPGIANQIKDTKAATEMSALKAWYSMLANDSARAFYGPGHVFAAHELGAIQTLLLSDSLFRVNDVAKRKRWVALVEEVEKGGGSAVIFSGAHVAGEQLTQLTGVAAILRFPLPDLEDQELIAEI